MVSAMPLAVPLELSIASANLSKSSSAEFMMASQPVIAFFPAMVLA